MKNSSRNIKQFSLLTAVFFVLCTCSVLIAQTKQEHVHHMAHSVMPFDVSKTEHIFRMTVFGGVQKVIAKSPGATDQITLIRHHLKHEAELFQNGDFTDPKKLHGADMPGLQEIQAGISHIKVSYTAIPSGGEIRYETSDLHLLTALHRWFGAQLSEHGADARSE